jgi:hypothetical protein
MLILSCISAPTNHNKDSYSSLGGWPGLNCFAARLFGSRLISQFGLGSWALMSAFEPTDSPAKDVLESRIIAASLWIEHSCQELYLALGTHVPDEQDVLPIQLRDAGVTLTFTLTKWLFWKRKFSGYIQSELSTHGVYQCAVAARVMTELSPFNPAIHTL